MFDLPCMQKGKRELYLKFDKSKFKFRIPLWACFIFSAHILFKMVLAMLSVFLVCFIWSNLGTVI